MSRYSFVFVLDHTKYFPSALTSHNCLIVLISLNYTGNWTGPRRFDVWRIPVLHDRAGMQILSWSADCYQVSPREGGLRLEVLVLHVPSRGKKAVLIPVGVFSL